jgi:hypothetical protein
MELDFDVIDVAEKLVKYVVHLSKEEKKEKEKYLSSHMVPK